MKSVVLIGAVGLAVVIGVANGFAEEPRSFGPLGAPPNSLTSPLLAKVGPQTPAGPAESIPAWTTTGTVQAWSETLSPDLRLEISERCSVIAGNAMAFPADTVAFCAAWTGGQADGVRSPSPRIDVQPSASGL